jgi:hypothetical protein
MSIDFFVYLISGIVIFSATGTLFLGWRLTLFPVMAALTITTALVGSIYLIFSYNAVADLPNGPFRYLFHIVNVTHYAVLIRLQYVKTREERAVLEKAKKVLSNGVDQ